MLVEVRDVSVTYPGGVRALDGVSFGCERGLVGLLGRNGAGKSTLFRVLASQQAVTAGAVRLDGRDITETPAAARGLLGYLPQDFGFPPALTARELVEHFAVLKGCAGTARARRDVAAAMLARVGLAREADRPTGALSGGMRQRVGIAIALLGAPRVLVVDEPTVALDPVERHRIHDLLVALAEEGVVLLSTHLVQDVEELCARVLVLHRGRLVRDATPTALLQALEGRVWRARVPHAQAAAMRAQGPVTRERLVGGAVELTVVGDQPSLPAFAAEAPTMHDVFAVATGA